MYSRCRCCCLLLIALIVILPVIGSCSASSSHTEPVYIDTIISENITSESIAANQFILSGSPLLIPAYGEIYNTAFLTIECDLADTYYLVSGNTTTGEILGFVSNGKGRITYTDITPSRVCLINTAMSISVPVDDRPAIISAKLYLNGVADDASYIGEYISDADPADALPIMCLVELINPGDYLEIYIASDTVKTTVVVNTMTLVATTVD